MKQHSPCDSFSSAQAKFGSTLNPHDLMSPLATSSLRGEGRSFVLRKDQQLRMQRASAIEQRQSAEHIDRLANQEKFFPDEVEQGRQQTTRMSLRSSRHPPLLTWSTETSPQRVISSVECTFGRQIEPAGPWEPIQKMSINVDLLTAMSPSCDGFFLQKPDESADSPMDLILDSYDESRNGRHRAIQLLPKMSRNHDNSCSPMESMSSSSSWLEEKDFVEDEPLVFAGFVPCSTFTPVVKVSARPKSELPLLTAGRPHSPGEGALDVARLACSPQSPPIFGRVYREF